MTLPSLQGKTFRRCDFTYVSRPQFLLQETTTMQSNEVNTMEANKEVSNEPAIEPKNEAVKVAEEYAYMYKSYQDPFRCNKKVARARPPRPPPSPPPRPPTRPSLLAKVSLQGTTQPTMPPPSSQAASFLPQWQMRCSWTSSSARTHPLPLPPRSLRSLPRRGAVLLGEEDRSPQQCKLFLWKL